MLKLIRDLKLFGLLFFLILKENPPREEISIGGDGSFPLVLGFVRVVVSSLGLGEG